MLEPVCHLLHKVAEIGLFRLKEGDFITYKLIASHNIKAGEEIVWCYGESYARNYETSCN